MYKFENKVITSQQNQTPPYEWSKNIFQTWQPVSGNFPLGNHECGNNSTGRAYYANPCGYWDTINPQLNSGQIKSNITMPGVLFPTGNLNNSNNVMAPPNDRVFRSYIRIGEEYRNS